MGRRSEEPPRTQTSEERGQVRKGLKTMALAAGDKAMELSGTSPALVTAGVLAADHHRA